jgi:hypothetical protein
MGMMHVAAVWRSILLQDGCPEKCCSAKEDCWAQWVLA